MGNPKMNEHDLIIDLFAGGGGASLGMEMAGLRVDIAVNHDPEALAVHRANHPDAVHFQEDVWNIDPLAATRGQPVYLLWASPDCKHFSKAKGASLVDRNIRSLAWVVIQWAKYAKPTIICLENVEEFQTWGPVIDGKPDPKRKGLTFNAWTRALKRYGYRVDWRVLSACDYGSPTIRKRMFLVARRDGLPIIWPESTHGPGLTPYRTAAECIDFSLPCPSIFERKRPLAENTMRRIARGIQKFVIDNPAPFILTYYGPKRTDDFRGLTLDKPLPTQTTENRFGLVTPFISRYFGQGIGEAIDNPAPTTTAGGGGKSALVAAFMAQHNTGNIGHQMGSPVSTITSRGTQQQLVTSHLMKFRGTCQHGQQTDLPFPTVTAGGNHLAEVKAFLIKYYGTNVGQSLREPAHTLTSKHKLGLVTVSGVDYQIIDIGMRMLTPRELFRAQGFPDSYVIDPMVNGKPMTKTSQVRLCGNSVCPQVAAALVKANTEAAVTWADLGMEADNAA